MWFPLEGSAPTCLPCLWTKSLSLYSSIVAWGCLDEKCLIFGGCDLTLPFCPLSCSRVTEVLTISGWRKEKDRNKLCKCTQLCTKCLYILLLVHCCCRRQWWWFIFSFNVIYNYIWIYEYKQSIGLQRKSTWGCYFFCSFWTFSLDFFFVFFCHHVKCICVLISFLLKKMLNVFQKCNGVDGVAQHRILKRNRQDIIRSEIEKATT